MSSSNILLTHLCECVCVSVSVCGLQDFCYCIYVINVMYCAIYKYCLMCLFISYVMQLSMSGSWDNCMYNIQFV